MGSDTANLQLGFVMINVLFLREHNRIARVLEDDYGWDDERLFPTTRNILTVILIKIVVEEYINHISPYHLKLSPTRPASATSAGTGRTGWRSSSTCSTAGTASCPRATASATATSRNDTLFNTEILVERGSAAASRMRRTSPPAASACSTRRLSCGRPR